MKKALIAVAALLLLSGALLAEEESVGKAIPIGDFDNTGQATFGYRFIDVKGYRPQFDQMFNLRPGFRLLDLNMQGNARDNTVPFADRYSISATGIGGDPFPSTQVMVSKNGLYDFRLNWRQSYYYWNQNDNTSLPITAVAPTFTSGLTNNHDWATVRKFASADFTLHASRNLQFVFETSHTGNNGTQFTTRSMDFFGSPAYWATFARSNPYFLIAPLRDSTGRITGGLDYTRHQWSFHYKAGYQTFDENITLNEVAANQAPINPTTLPQSQPLAQLSWSQSRQLKTPISEFSYVGKVNPRFELRGSYVYNKYHGPAALDESANGIGPNPNSAILTAPYAFSQSGRATVSQPSHVLTQGFTYEIQKWWDFDVDYRYLRFNSDSTAINESLLNGTVQNSGIDNTVWRNGMSDLDVGMTFRAGPKFSIRPGIRLLKSDIESFENGVIDDARTSRINTARPEIAISYRPASNLRLSGDVRSATSGASYTAISPHRWVRGRMMVHYQPLPQLSIENSLNISNSSLEDSNYQSNVRANSTTVSYAWDEHMSMFGGFTYDSFYAAGNIQFARGPAPLAGMLRDTAINRVWQGGVEIQPVSWAGIRFSGNYERTTGEGQVNGEPPAYGPLTWPMATTTVYFNVPRAGRISIDLQRTYYTEELVPVNNYSANILTLRWTRNF